MLDMVIRGEVVDGSGGRPQSATSASATGASSRSARSTRRRHGPSTPTGWSSRPASSTSTRTTTRRCSGTRRCTPVAAARRDDGDRRQLRVHASRPLGARATATTCMRMLARVEGMPLAALAAGRAVGLDARFGEYLDRIDGTLAVERRLPRRPLGAAPRRDGRRRRSAARRPPSELDAMAALLRDEPRGRRPRLLVVVGAHATTTATATRCRRAHATDDELLALCRGRARPPGHHARVHPRHRRTSPTTTST